MVPRDQSPELGRVGREQCHGKQAVHQRSRQDLCLPHLRLSHYRLPVVRALPRDEEHVQVVHFHYLKVIYI